MPYDVAFKLPRSFYNERIIGSLGFTKLRWDAKRDAYVARGTSRAICAMGQQPETVLPKGCWESIGKGWGYSGVDPSAVSKDTLRRFARAAAVADGNAFFGSSLDRAEKMESQYMNEALHTCMVLEGLGVDPDAFASMYPDPLACFSKLSPPPIPMEPVEPAALTSEVEADEV